MTFTTGLLARLYPVRGFLTWLGWVILSFSTAVPGSATPPGEWYDALAKPEWTPPGWVFPIVWSTLYVLMGTAAWRVQRRAKERGTARVPLSLFVVQLGVNATWTPTFFGAQLIFPALIIILVLWFAIAATALAFRKVHPTAALLLAPYLVWVSIATVLNFQIWQLNA